MLVLKTFQKSLVIQLLSLIQSFQEDRFDKLKDLDYKELLKMKIAPKDLHFSTKPAKFEAFFESTKFQCFVQDLILYCKVQNTISFDLLFSS